MSILKTEFNYLLKGIKNTEIRGISRRKLVFELLSNGIAALVAMGAYKLVTLFFRKKNIIDKAAEKVRVLEKFQRKDKIAVDETAIDLMSGVIAFVIGLIVFTIVEQVMESYLREREKNVN